MELYDFHFSAQAQIEAISTARAQGKEYTHSFFKGRLFTERVEVGKKPLTAHNDLTFIGTGTQKDVTYI